MQAFCYFSLASPGLRIVLDILCTCSSYFLQYNIKNNHISGPSTADLEVKQLCGSSHWVDSRVNRYIKEAAFSSWLSSQGQSRKKVPILCRAFFTWLLPIPLGLILFLMSCTPVSLAGCPSHSGRRQGRVNSSFLPSPRIPSCGCLYFVEHPKRGCYFEHRPIKLAANTSFVMQIEVKDSEISQSAPSTLQPHQKRKSCLMFYYYYFYSLLSGCLSQLREDGGRTHHSVEL